MVGVAEMMRLYSSFEYKAANDGFVGVVGDVAYFFIMAFKSANGL